MVFGMDTRNRISFLDLVQNDSRIFCVNVSFNKERFYLILEIYREKHFRS